jgi:GT2 family glycosyltransferase/tetratricopeptide (TPR) repeat protein
MIITLIPYCPRSEGKNLGFAYNELMGRLRDDDWACFLDHDACFATPDWYAQLEEITAGLTEPCVLTALTNRVGSRWQLAPGVDRDNHAMDYHRRVGKAIQAASRGVLRDVTHESLMSGVVILLSKETWRRLGGFADGFLGVDNAIHQAARDRGGRVYLMAGVYVYHWYRADALEGRHEGQALGSRVPVTGRRILLIGHDVGQAGVEIAARRPASLSVVELAEPALERTRQRLGDVPCADDEGNGVAFADGSFDAILAADLLERVRRPERILRRLRRWLAPDGRLITSFRTARSLTVVDGLLAGRWLAGPGPEEGHGPIRFFTRREVEKLLYRTGFDPNSVDALPGPGHAEWVARGRPGQVRMDRLSIAGLLPHDAEEFHASGFLVEATAPRVPDTGLTSIIIVTFNQLDYTRQCVESIRRLTDEPYELIFVDNGSSDETAAYLEALPGARVIRNAENRGFPAAANQGIAAAAGAQLLLLNNDTIATTGWLRRLLAPLHGDPKIGLAGPCSNFVGSEQQVEASYDSPAGLDGFAWEWGKAHDRELVDTHRLIGFCLLIRRAVVDAIGLLDERFGIGCFEDDDYCLRAIRAGFRVVIARDAFVHHYGGRTFLGTGIDLAGLLRENERRFREKWRPELAGDSPPARALPAPPPQPARFAVELARGGGLLLRRDRVRLSLCMIVRDSATTLRPCLESIRPWVDEMIVVDTGSTDETPRIVEELGGRLFHFPWCDDFSAARNESLRLARGDWIFWMDSDDTIPPACGRQLRALLDRAAEPGVLGYVVQVHCPGGGSDGDPESDMTVVDHVKLIRNRPDLRFEGRIHEQVLPALRRAGGTVAWTELYVVHSGSDPSPEAQDRKRRRDLHLLHLELREQPEHTFTLFNLGMTYADAGRFEEAEEFLRRSIRHSNPEESHLRKAYALLVYAEMRLGRREAALETCRRGQELFPADAELRFRAGVLLHELGRLEEAVQAYRAVLATHEQRHFRSIDRGLTGFKARQNLAVVYTDLGNLQRAEEEWREVTRAVPRYRPGWRGLGEVLIRGGRHQEAMAVAEQFLGDPALRVEGHLLKSRLAMAAGDLAAARAEIEHALAEDPGDRAALEARCHLLFEHGPPAEAEAALRALIDRDPNDASAHHNLGMLLLRLKRYDQAARSFRQALRHRADAPATYLHLGYALKESDRLPEAVAAWQQVLRLAPDDAAARAELARAKRPETGSITPLDPNQSMQEGKGPGPIGTADSTPQA